MFLLYQASSNQHLYALSSKFDKYTQTRRFKAKLRKVYSFLLRFWSDGSAIRKQVEKLIILKTHGSWFFVLDEPDFPLIQCIPTVAVATHFEVQFLRA